MNILKNNLFYTTLISLVVATSILATTIVLSTANNDKSTPDKVNGRYLSENEINALNNTPEVKIKKQKMESRLENSWKDIINTYSINENEYVKVTLEDIHKNDLEKVSPIFSEEKFSTKFFDIYEEFSKKPVIGSLKPIILVKKDKSEILYAFKTKDGVNNLFKSKKNGEEWYSSNERKIGNKPE